MTEIEQLPLKSCPGCNESKPATRDEFYEDARTPTGLASWCKDCEKARVTAYQRSPKGRLAKRRRDVLLKQARAALRSGALARVYPCEFVDGNCDGVVAAHFPDEEKPEEFFWLCSHHRELIGRLKVPPSYERLALLVDRWV